MGSKEDSAGRGTEWVVKGLRCGRQGLYGVNGKGYTGRTVWATRSNRRTVRATCRVSASSMGSRRDSA
eukprot:8789732-Pyramimonas_sp.AAC.2